MKKFIIITLIILSFGTVAYANWYDTAIEKVRNLGIMQGDERGFRPNDYITRAETAQVISNLIDTNINTVAKTIPSTVQISTETSAGSGVYIAPNKILTANHVASGTIKVTTYQGKTVEGKIIKNNSILDLAIIEVSEIGSPVKLSEGIRQGETVLVIGNPLSLNKSVSRGILSATDRIVNLRRVIQIDAPVNAGNSGGGVFNVEGELIGIVNSKYTHNDAEGLGFATHLEILRSFTDGHR